MLRCRAQGLGKEDFSSWSVITKRSDVEQDLKLKIKKEHGEKR